MTYGNGYYGYGNGYGGGDPDALGMDLSGVQAWQEYDVLPAGEYPVFIRVAEKKISRTGGVEYLSLSYGITAGQFKGRVLFDTFFLWSEKNMISLQRFKALRAAVGLNPNTGGRVSELPNREFLAKVKVRPRRNSDNGERENYVAEYYSLSAAGQNEPAPSYGQYAAPEPAPTFQSMSAPQPTQAPFPNGGPAHAPQAPQPSQAPRAPQVSQAPQPQPQATAPRPAVKTPEPANSSLEAPFPIHDDMDQPF